VLKFKGNSGAKELITPYCIFKQCGSHIYHKITLLLLIRTSTLTAPLYIVSRRHVTHQIFPSYNVTLLFEIPSLAVMPVSLSISRGSSYQLVVFFCSRLQYKCDNALNYLKFHTSVSEGLCRSSFLFLINTQCVYYVLGLALYKIFA